MDVHVRPVRPTDRAQWQSLWEGYCRFYETDLSPAQTDLTWARFFDPNRPLRALVATNGPDGLGSPAGAGAELLGLAHWLIHPSTWSRHGYAYLEDLFTAPAARGQGVARALIEATAQAAHAAQADKLYWHTRHDNATARAFYDRVARHTGFVHYAIALPITGPAA